MNVVAIDGNPRTDRNNTSPVLTPFIDGMREAGAEVTYYHTEKLQIKQCRGCNRCLNKTPGECFQRDDMKVILPVLSQAEVWVFATGSGADRLGDSVRRFVDRMLPLTKTTGQTGHSSQSSLKKFVGRFLSTKIAQTETNQNPAEENSGVESKPGKVVLVSNGGSGDMSCYAALVREVQAIAKSHRREFAGTVSRPNSRPGSSNCRPARPPPPPWPR